MSLQASDPGRILAALRQEHHWTLEEAACRADVAPASIQALEANTDIAAPERQRILQLYGLTDHTLRFIAAPPRPPRYQEQHS